MAKFSSGVGDCLKKNVTVARDDTHAAVLLRLRKQNIILEWLNADLCLTNKCEREGLLKSVTMTERDTL